MNQSFNFYANCKFRKNINKAIRNFQREFVELI